MEIIHFYTTKKQIVSGFVLLVSLLCLSMFGTYYFFENDEYGTVSLREIFGSYAPLPYTISISMFYLSAGCAVLLFIGLLFGIKNLKGEKIVATVTDNDITIGSYGTIAWEDIAEIRIIKVHGQKLLGFSLVDPSNFLRRYSLKKSMLCLMSYQMCGAHITIGQVNVPVEQALEIINVRHFLQK